MMPMNTAVAAIYNRTQKWPLRSKNCSYR